MKKNLIAFVVFLLLLLGKHANAQAINQLDDRFGLTARPDQFLQLGIPWGSGIGIYDEEHSLIPQGTKVWFLLGQLGNGGFGSQSSTYFGNTLTGFEQQYLQDSQDHTLYSDLSSFLTNVHPNRNIPNVNESDANEYVKITFLLSAHLTQQYPGSYFAVGNEEDWGPYLTPAQYAEYYRIFYTWIKKHDLSAKVMIGGLAGFTQELIDLGPPKVATSNDHYAWIEAFRESYKTNNGSYPPIDVWSIHPYTFLTYPPGVNHIGPANYTDMQYKIIDFKDFLNRNGEGNKPLWATEFGIQAYEGDISSNLEDEWAKIANDYEIPLLDWLKSTNYLDRWFWYGAFPYHDALCNGSQPWAGCIYKYPDENGLYNPLGTAYKDSALNSPLYNRDFETAGTKPFRWSSFSQTQGAGYSLGLDSSEIHTGTKSAKLQIGSTAGAAGFFNALYQDMSNPSLVGKNIKISAWTKTANQGQSGLTISLGFTNGTVDGTFNQIAQASHVGWTQLTTNCLTIPANVTWVRVNGVVFGQSATAWFDDLNLETGCNSSVTASLSASPTSVTSGQPSTLTWSSTNATSCTASGAWSGTKATTGSQTVNPTTSSTYTLACTGAGGTATQSATVTVTSISDTTPPIVSITSPSNNTTVWSSVTVSANASDNVGVVGVQFKLDGTNFSAEDTTSPYSIIWNTTQVSNGGHTLTATARDAAGNQTVSSGITVTVNNVPANQLPVGSFDEIRTTDGVVRGWSYDPDNSSASNPVQIFFNGPVGTGTLVFSGSTNVLRTDVNNTFGITGNHGFEFTIPNQYRNGVSHSVYVYGIDINDSSKSTLLTGSPKSFNLTILDTTPPVISAVSSSSISTNTATITWTTNETADTQVDYGTTSGYGSVTTLNPLMVTSHSQSLTSLLPATFYHYRVKSKDSSSNLTTSGDFTFTTTSSSDTSAPSVPTSLAAAATSTSQINLSWFASTDNVGVVGYKVFRNQTQIAAAITATSYIDTGLIPSTSYSYTVSAFDAAGNNSAQSSSVSATTQTPIFDFIISSGGSKSVSQGSAVTNIITSTLSSGSTTSVAYSVSGLPAGALALFSPTLCNPTCTTTLTITTSASTPVATSTITVTGTTGSISHTTSFNLTVNDGVAPTTSISAPAINSTVSGSTILSALASDNVGVVGVQFRLDGANLGTEDTSSPYSISWNTSTSINGTHTLTAVARDFAGNVTNSSAVTVTVNNTVIQPPPPPPPAPTVSIAVAPATINSGQEASLTWSSTDATSISIDQSIGTVGSSGTRIITPVVTTTYTITVANVTGSATQSVTLTVNPIVIPPPTPTPPTIVFSDGSLINDHGTIYIIEYGRKRGFTSMAVFTGFGYKLSNVATADISYIPSGSVLATSFQRHPRGTLVVSSGTVYFLGAYLRYPFPSATVFYSWGNQFKDVVPGNSYDLLPAGPIVQMK